MVGLPKPYVRREKLVGCGYRLFVEVTGFDVAGTSNCIEHRLEL